MLYDDNRAKKDAEQQAYLREGVVCKCLLPERTIFDRLFGKPNCNIVNELDGSSEPTLF